MNPKIFKWLESKPTDLGLSPMALQTAWAKHKAAFDMQLIPDPGLPPLLSLSGAEVSTEQLQGLVANATGQLRKLTEAI
jgi:hypothetical protein